jgi:NAD(P)-dependent dehydrogenase (short-subunit alcohol dehydrogenase family)
MAESMHGKTIVITGGTGGIGKQTALGLAQRGAQVVITGRDRARGEAARAELVQASGNRQIELLCADMSSQAEVRRLAAELLARYERLDVLINNAGLVEAQRRLTVDGVEAHFAVNVVAPFLLTHLLFPLLQRSAPSRVITLSGGLPRPQVAVADLQAEHSFRGLVTYTRAKAAMMAMSYEFAERTRGSGVGMFVVYPGSAETAMSRGLTPEMVPLALRLVWPLFRLMLRDTDGNSATRAARSSIFAASDARLNGQTGQYYDTNGRLTAWPPSVVDSADRAAVWHLCEAVTGISPETASTFHQPLHQQEA